MSHEYGDFSKWYNNSYKYMKRWLMGSFVSVLRNGFCGEGNMEGIYAVFLYFSIKISISTEHEEY